MTTDHDGVRELLAAWALDALPPADQKTVPSHLACCEPCATEAERLRETVRLLDAAPNGTAGPDGQAPAAGPDGVLAVALRARPPAARVAEHAAPYAGAVAGLQALLAEPADRDAWDTPVVHGWDVHATVAHLLAADEPLVRRLGLNTRVPDSRIPADLPWGDAWAVRTADVIAHERVRTPAATVAAWRAQADSLLASPEAHDPELAARSTTLMGMRLSIADHFLVRAFEVWIHTDDIGRALGQAVPPPPDPHLWQLIPLAVRVLTAVLGPTAPPVLFTLTGKTRNARWTLGSPGTPARAELTLDPVDFCLLVGGRYDPTAIPREVTGDATAAQNVLDRAASLSWL